MTQEKLGILAAGGPAPGINSVIAAATIRANLSGQEVIGLRDGFRHIMEGRTDEIQELTIDNVTPIHYRGGSVLGIDRANPVRENKLEQTVQTLLKLGIGQLICIGGDGTAYTAMRLLEAAGDRLRIVHVPKTIDNDLLLPEGVPTFGFETARHVGTGIVQNLRADAETTSRWYFVVAMGRQAGHLALGMGKAAGATITLIPEEFAAQTPLSEMVDILAGSIIKRLAQGRRFGVAVIAEGLAERMADGDLQRVAQGAARDQFGKVRLADVNLGEILRDAVSERLEKLPSGLKPTIQDRTVGYELRCADPIPFDMEYTRDLGYSATKFLLEGGSGAMITIERGLFRAVRFEDILDRDTQRTIVRNVNLETESYKIARRYMLRLRKDDFTKPEVVASFAKVAGLTPEEFRAQFEYVTTAEAPPLSFGRRWRSD